MMKMLKVREHVYDYVKQIEPGLKYLWVRGWDLLAPLAHSALESAWGQSLLARKYNNYFGIKGRGVEMLTVEYENGKPVKRYAFFRRYDDVVECFADYDLIVKEDYPGAYAVRWNAESYFRIIAGRWATDPRYFEKLMNIYNYLYTIYLEQDILK